jgi:single-strand DNA-binding protein
VRTLESGNKVANITLATNRYFKGQDGSRQEETEWHNVVLWGNLADLAEKYLTKGRQVFIEGRIRTRQWEDKEGNKRYTTEIVAENMTFVGGGSGNQQEAAPKADDMTSASTPQGVEDDLPF